MKRIAAYVAAAALLAVQAVPLAVAQTQVVPPLNPAPQTQDGITYVSGGIADDWQQAMEAQRGQLVQQLEATQEQLEAQQKSSGAERAKLEAQAKDLQLAHVNAITSDVARAADPPLLAESEHRRLSVQVEGSP